jgi:predicted nucleic acid-binding protein
MGTLEITLARLTGKRVYIDANIFIYFLDRHPVYFDAVAAFFKACATREIFGVTGEAAVAEVMVFPYRQDEPALVSRFKRFFTQKNFLWIASHDHAVFEATAMLVARKRLKFIDALHMATAIQTDCPFFITNDSALTTTEGLEVIQLKDLLK